MSISRLKGGPSLTLVRASTGETTRYTITNFNTPLINLSSYGEWRITPNSTFYAELLMWGAGGGTDDGTKDGGGGGFSSGTYKFEPGITHVIWVGQGGQSYTVRTQAFGGGGTAGTNGYGLGGGGLTGMFKTSVTQANSIIIAGGGGGGGGSAANQTGGGGGGTAGTAGGTGFAGGGTQSAGGLYGGAALSGGSMGTGVGAGGGGGYWGGGQQGAASNGADAHGGGGGSGFLHPSLINSTTTAGVAGGAPGNSGSVYRGTSGNPGATSGAPCFDGRFILIPVATPR